MSILDAFKIVNKVKAAKKELINLAIGGFFKIFTVAKFRLNKQDYEVDLYITRRG